MRAKHSTARWLLNAGLLTATVMSCRLNYETLSDAALGGASGASFGGVGASANAGEPGSGGDQNSTAGNASGGSVAGAEANGGEASGGEATGGSAGSGGDAGSGGSGGSGGSAGSGGSGGSGGTAGSAGSAGSGGSPVGDLIVTTNADENDAGATAVAPGGSGLSLREAITIANATAGSQLITFQSGVVVAATDTLPTIADTVAINGGEVNAAAVPNNRECLIIAAGPTTIDGLELYGCRSRPIHVTGGSDVHIRNCSVHDNSTALEVASTAGTGVVIGPGNQVSASGSHCVYINNDNALLIDNRISDCGSAGVFLSGSAAGTRVIGNLIARASFGITMGSSASGTVMWHNTIVMSSGSGINIGQASPNDLRNNIIALNGIYGVAAADARFSQNDYNLYFGNSTGACNPCMLGANSQQADPLFVDALNDDFTLQASSPAINAGAALGADRNGAAAGDFNGAAPDLGYQESP